MFLKNIVLVLMALLVFALPWGTGAFNIGIGPLGLMSIFGILAFLFALLFLLFGQQGFGRTPVPLEASIVLFGFFVALNLASIGWALDPRLALSSSITLIQLFVLAWLLAFLRLHRRGFETLLHALFLGCLFVAISLVPETLGQTESKRLEGFGMDANFLPYTLALGIPIAFYLAQKMKVPLLGWLYLSYIPLAIVLIILSGSRGVFLSLVVAVAVLLWAVYRGGQVGARRVSRAHMIGTLGILAVVFVVFTLNYAHLMEAQFDRIMTVTDPMASDIGGRKHLWLATLGVYLDHLLLGVGSGNYQIAMIPYFEGDVFIFSFVEGGASSHNVFLAVAADTGTVGLLIYLLMLFALLRNMRKLDVQEKALFFSLFGVSVVAALTLPLESARIFYLSLFLPLAYAPPAPMLTGERPVISGSRPARSELSDASLRTGHGPKESLYTVKSRIGGAAE